MSETPRARRRLGDHQPGLAQDYTAMCCPFLVWRYDASFFCVSNRSGCNRSTPCVIEFVQGKLLFCGSVLSVVVVQVICVLLSFGV